MPGWPPTVKLLGLSLLTICLWSMGPRRARGAQPPPPPTIADLEKRIRELEDIVKRLQAQQAPNPSASPTSSPPSETTPEKTAKEKSKGEEGEGKSSDPSQPKPAAGKPGDAKSSGGKGEESKEKSTGPAGWTKEKGFFLRSADGNFILRTTGQIQGDYRAYLDGNDYTDIDSFLIRRARLGIEADMAKYYEFRLLPDFGTSQSPGQPAQTRLTDAYLNIHYVDSFQMEVGKFKQPFSFEQLIPDRYVPFLERSLIDQMVPARDVGLMCHGVNLFDKRLDYGVAVSNGQRNGDYDSNMLKDVNGRLAVRPFADTDLLKGWQIGFSMGTGVEEEPVSPNPLRTPGNVPFLQFNSTVRANGRRIRYSPELAYCYGPLGLAAQYFHMEQRLQPTFSGPGSSYILQIPFEGFYVMGTLLLTGEKRTSYKEQLAPLHPFDPCHFCHAPGAWELVGRVSRLEVGSQVFQPLPVSQTSYVNLANPIGNSSGATEMTLGFNWYLNSWVRLQFNWEHAWFDQAVRLGPGPDGLMRHQDSLLVRTQIIF